MSRLQLAKDLVCGKKFMEGQKQIGGGSDFLKILPFWCAVHHHDLLYGMVQFVAVHSNFSDFCSYKDHGAVLENYIFFWFVGAFIEFPTAVSLSGIDKRFTGCLQGLWRVVKLRPCEATFLSMKQQIEIVYGVYEPL